MKILPIETHQTYIRKLNDLLHLFRKNWDSKKYTLPGAKVLIAVSGGSDSMVMADLFLKSGISFGVAHCNFGLRGEASDMDARFVTAWCIKHSVPLHSVLFDTKAKCEEWKMGTQETARKLRYDWFEEVRKQYGYTAIATAHHANDNVETLLINLFKGTGISGLHGIRPVHGYIIRPLLFAAKEMIEAYIAEHKIKYRDDASNASDDYLRNAVRHKIVPVVNELFTNAIANVNDSITRFAEAEILYRKAIDNQRKKLIEQRGKDYYIPLRKLQQCDPLSTIVYELLQPFGFAAAQLPHLLDLLNAGTGRFISSATHRVIRNRDFLVITAALAAEADLMLIEAVPCTIDTGKYVFSFAVQQRPKEIPADVNEAYLDFKTITFPIVLRTWKQGDYFYPIGMKMKKKKVSRLLIDQKVALHDKEDIRILECNKRIAWVSGIRIDERFKITTNTEQVLVVKRSLKKD